MKKKLIQICSVPLDLGIHLRGVDMGPSAIYIAGISQALEELGFEVKGFEEDSVENRWNIRVEEEKAMYLPQINSACASLFEKAKQYKSEGGTPIFLGGDHSIAMGTVSGVSSFYQEKKESVGLIWFDAHADMNTPESSISGNVHGMPLAALLGKSLGSSFSPVAAKSNLSPDKVCLVGVRDLDKKERELVKQSGIHVFSMKDIDILGMAEVTKQVIEISTKDTAGFHLSFDIDGLDADIAPGVGTPVQGGVNFREAHTFMELLYESKKLLSMDIVELNPIKDVRNMTAELVVGLVRSLFGKEV